MNTTKQIDVRWSANLAYAIGLITSDGNLSKDGRHITLTSKDKEIVLNFRECLGIKNKISRKARGTLPYKKYFYVQFGNKEFYNFLLSIGLTPAKSKTIRGVNVSSLHFADFLRGLLDGDGNINIFRHPESQYPQLRVRFFSASPVFIEWMKFNIEKFLDIKGFSRKANREIDLAYAKTASVKLLNYIYYKNFRYCLKRKYLKAQPFLIA